MKSLYVGYPLSLGSIKYLISKLTTPLHCKSTIEKFLVNLGRLGCGIQQLMGQEVCCLLVTSGCLVLQTSLEYSAE